MGEKRGRVWIQSWREFGGGVVGGAVTNQVDNGQLFIAAASIRDVLTQWAEKGWLDSDTACALGRDIRHVIEGVDR